MPRTRSGLIRSDQLVAWGLCSGAIARLISLPYVSAGRGAFEGACSLATVDSGSSMLLAAERHGKPFTIIGFAKEIHCRVELDIVNNGILGIGRGNQYPDRGAISAARAASLRPLTVPTTSVNKSSITVPIPRIAAIKEQLPAVLSFRDENGTHKSRHQPAS